MINRLRGDELDATEIKEARNEDGLDGEESQLPDDFVNCFNVTTKTMGCGRNDSV